MKRFSTFIEVAPDFNKKIYNIVIAVFLNKKIEEIEKNQGAKKSKKDWDQIKNSNEFLSTCMELVREIMAGRIMPPTSEEIILFLEEKYEVIICY